MSVNFCAGFAPVKKPTIPPFSDGGIIPMPKGVPPLSDGGINPNPEPKCPKGPHICYLA